MGKKVFWAVLFLSLAVIIGVFGALYIFRADVAVLSPKGIIAERQMHLMVNVFLIMLIVVVPVFAITGYVIWKFREGNEKQPYFPDWNHSHIAEAVWWGLPMVIIVVLSVMAWTSSQELDPFKPLESDQKPLTIEVVALQWKWLFIYPEQNIAVVNYFEIPVNRPVHFRITADAPMNSFWIPELGGQIYAMPGMESKLHLMAEVEGLYRGSSANLSGEGFSGMSFKVKGLDDKAFNDWVGSVKRASKYLDEISYEELAKPSKYVPVQYYQLGKKDLFDWVVRKPERRKS